MRPARTINYAALGWTAVAFFAAIALILVVPLAWHLTVALWTSGAAWWLAVVAGVVVTLGALSVAYKRAEESIDLLGRVYELEADVRDLTAALAEATATLADARVVIPLQPVAGPRRQNPIPDARKSGGMVSRFPEQRTDSWLEQVMDEQAQTWPTDGGA